MFIINWIVDWWREICLTIGYILLLGIIIYQYIKNNKQSDLIASLEVTARYTNHRYDELMSARHWITEDNARVRLYNLYKEFCKGNKSAIENELRKFGHTKVKNAPSGRR